MEEDEGCSSMVEKREDYLVEPNNKSQPTLKTAYFLKPTLNPNKKTFPEFLPSKQPLTPNLQLINKRVIFKAIVKPLNSWKSWVNALQQTHEEAWKKVGIYDAIKSSTYHVIRDNKLIIELAESWCCETNTFVFPWGECTVTLEDVMVLGGYSVLGVSAGRLTVQFPTTDSFDKGGGDLRKMMFEDKVKIQKKCKKTCVSHDEWMSYFKGRGGEVEHVAFLVSWLSRYVFTRSSYSQINCDVFSIAISLSRGVRIALAPVILASIYRDLRLLKQEIVHCMIGDQDDGSKLVVWAPLHLVQVWAWERFPTLSPKPCSLAFGEPRVARWHEVRDPKAGRMRVGYKATKIDHFLWRPYALQLENWKIPGFYSDQQKWVVVDSEDENIQSYARCLRSCELGGIGCVEHYLPQRVALQFALDQDIPFCAPTMSEASELVWNSYEKPIDGLKLYIPPRLCEGGVSLRYHKWWNKVDGVDDLGNNIVMPTENSLANELNRDAEMNLQLEPEEAGICNERNENSRKEREDMSEENKSQEGAHSLGNGDDIPTEVAASVDLPPGVEEEVRNRQGNDMREEVENEVNEQSMNMIEGTMIISDDEEETDVVQAFIAQVDKLEARIARLENMRAIRKEAKMKSKAT